MHDRIIITITDMEGSKHFNVHQIIKKIILAIILVVVIAFVTGVVIIKGLFTNVEALELKKNNLSQVNMGHEKRINELNSLIGQKSLELKAFLDSLEDIESLMGLKESKNLPFQDRVDLTKVNFLQKRYLMKSVPNGSPLNEILISDQFGWRNHPVKNKKVFHKGVDLKAEIDSSVWATADGVVEYAGFHNKSGFGNLLIIIHNYGFKSYYAHLNSFKVKIGDIISKGQEVALTGTTGLSNGPHLHYEVRYIGVSIDPIHFINWTDSNYESIFKTTTGIKWQSLITMIMNNP